MSNPKNCSGARVNGPGAVNFYVFTKPAFIVGSVIILFAACAPSMEDHREKSAAADAVIANEYAGLYRDTINGVTHNFIRSADMKFEVKDVLSCTNIIESTVKKAGGYTTKSNLNTEIASGQSTRIRKDSVLETRMYITRSFLTIRVPAPEFDTTLKQITGLGLFIDYRRTSADDVKGRLYSNAIQNKNYLAFSKNVEKKAEANNKLNDVVKAQEAALEKKLLSGETELNSYELYELVNYSTIVIELYQSQQVSHKVVAAMPTVAPYETPFVEQLWDAITGSLTILKKIFLLLAWSWSVLLPVILVFFILKRRRIYERQETKHLS